MSNKGNKAPSKSSNWIVHDLDASLRPAMQTFSNSRLAAKTIKHLQSKGEHKHATTLMSTSHEVLQNNLLPALTKLRTLDPPPAEDFSSAFDKLLHLPGFEEWQPQITSLQKRIENQQERGDDLRKNRKMFHALIISKDSKIAEDFAGHYYSVLLACGVFNADEKAIRADGTHDKVLKQAYGCGLCLLQNAEELSSGATTRLSEKMLTEDVIFVANYTKSNEVPAKSLDDRFFLRFDFVEALSKNALPRILKRMESWSDENSKELEGGIGGIYARTFASKIAENKKNDEGSMEERLRLALADVHYRQDLRLELSHANGVKADQSWISREDLLGREPNLNTFHTKAWDTLQDMIGLDEVKASLRSFLNGVLLDFRREMHGKKPLRSGLSRLFLGPPGTGKTTVGKLYGQILSHFGMLTSGEFVFKNATDFIGAYRGHSEKQTKNILRDAAGKVLMIDEAYMLDPYRTASMSGPDSYRQAVIDTIVGEVQNSPGEDICVIMCGYKVEMERMLKRSNPGLARRFPIADAFVFEEFDIPQLEMVLDQKMKVEVGCTMTAEAKSLAMEMLSFAKEQPNFGNGGEINNMLGRAMANYRMRLNEMPSEDQSGDVCFLPEDLDPHFKDISKVEDEVEPLFEHMIGMQDQKDRFQSLARRSTSLRACGRKPTKFMPFHFVFKGQGGTGKKAVAKKLGWLYRTMRLLPSDEVVEASAREMLAERVTGGAGDCLPGTSTKVLETIEKALGRVLFIGDAHRLIGSGNDQVRNFTGDPMEEFIDTVNKPRFLGKMVVILAGPEAPMDRMLNAHSGLANRFRIKMQFRPLTGDACFNLLQEQIKGEELTVAITAEEQQEIKRAFGELSRSKEWANGREIQGIVNELIGDVYEKGPGEDCRPSITGDEILQYLRVKHPSLSRAAENLSRLNVERQKLNHIIAERHAQEPVKTTNGSDNANMVLQNTAGHFEYRKLPKGRYIRVLHLLPSPNFHDPIQCDLEEFSLDSSSDQQRGFRAVSYVWGSQDRTELVSCEGKTFLTTRSCDLVLRNLRQKQNACRLWIDAICISQKSTEERNQQVLLMGDIFKSARQVYIWLGQGSQEITTVLHRFQKLACLDGDWGKHELIQKILFRKYQGDPEDFETLRSVMRNQWWQRLWTFQEFVVARQPVMVVGNVHILWDDFYSAVTGFAASETNDQMLTDHIGTQGRGVLWIEITEIVMARRAYQERLPKPHRPLSMSHFLIQTRNRGAQDPRDKLYGLHYLFQFLGYRLPEIDYNKTVAEIYEEVSRCLVKQSQSWWILTHLFSRRDLSTLGLPSWVPDFNSHADWHQHINVRSQNASDYFETFEDKSLANQEFQKMLLEVHSGALRTSAIFLWTVTNATPEMPTNSALDLSMEQRFEEAMSGVLEDAKEDFLFVLSSWLKLMDPSESMQAPESSSDDLTEPEDDGTSDIESQMIQAVTCAFYRSSANMFRAGTRKLKESIRSGPDEEPEVTEARAEALQGQAMSFHFISKLLGSIRRCISPDARHPCRYCGTKLPHPSGEAAEHLFQWMKGSWEGNTGDIIALLYSRAVDHSLFQTNATEGCGGHFGFCRNLPRVGDDVVLLPGLQDPVILRRKPGARSGNFEYYRVVGVTTGMVGPPVLDAAGDETKGDYCLGTCAEISSSKGREPTSFYLV